MIEEGVIDKAFHHAHDLLLSTDSGSESLFQLLMMQHHKITAVSQATIDIHLYSSSSCLYKYAKAITKILYVQALNKRLYSDKETSFMFLSHLDTSKSTTERTTLHS